MHILSIAWLLGSNPYIRGIVAGLLLAHSILAFLNGDTEGLSRRIAAEMIAAAASGINASLGPPTYVVTNAHLWFST